MALTKSRSYDTPNPRDYDGSSTSPSTTPAPASSSAKDNTNTARRGQDFGSKPASPDTYIKMRFQDKKEMPETWFKMSTHDGVRTFTPSDRSPVVFLQREGDTSIKMYYADAKHNFLTGNPEGMLAEIRTVKRRDGQGVFLGGIYKEEGGQEQRLVGSMVGKEANTILQQMDKASFAEWKARKDAERAAEAAKPQEPQMIAGQELEFGF